MIDKPQEKTTTTNPSKKRDEIAGVVLLIVFMVASFGIGVSVGHTPADAADIAKRNAQLDRIEAAIHSRACQEAVIDAAQEPEPRQQ